jgi:hypothetical protein
MTGINLKGPVTQEFLLPVLFLQKTMAERRGYNNLDAKGQISTGRLH